MDDPLQIAICEDTKSDEEKLLALLEQCATPSETAVFHSGEELLEVYRPHTFDLLLTDIYMGGISGVETVTRIRDLGDDIPVAFVTTSTDFALEGYRLSVLKYIEKPFQKRDLEEMLALAKMKRDNTPSLTVPHNGRDERIPFSQIAFAEQETHHVNIYLMDGSVLQFYENLAALIPQLEQQGFFQPHKSFSVNLSCVRSLDSELRCFIMQNGKNVPIRRESMSKARKALQEHLFNRTRSIST